MPIQSSKRYSVMCPYKNKLEIEFYVDKYSHAFLVAKLLKDAGNKVVEIYDNRTGKRRTI